MNYKSKQYFRQLAAATLTGITTIALFGCQNRSVPTQSSDLTGKLQQETVVNREMDDTFRGSTADFSIRLFQQSLETTSNPGGNLLISPESVLTALAMTANGAGSSTLTEMESVLGGGMSIQELNEYMGAYHKRLTNAQDVTFHQANSIWIKNNPEEIQVNEDFLQTDQNYYQADAYLADFDETTANDINNWVDTNTNHMIPQLLTEIPEDVVLYLVNALAFEGEWETPYEEVQINETGIFTDNNGNQQNVTMLHSTEAQYISGETETGFLKNYAGGDYAFLALLPEEGIALEDYIASMSGEDFLALYDNRSYEEVMVQIPEFTYDCDIELSPALSAMGMPEAFTRAADFSQIAESSTGCLYINRVLHKTHIELDRAGTKAAAVTAIEMTNEAAMLDPYEPPAVYLDRPFVYAIIDTESGLPIFLGAVNSIQ